MALPFGIRRRLTRALGEAMISRDDSERIDRLAFGDAGHGYDSHGLHPDGIRVGVGLSRFFYEKYFRVASHGSENIPKEGAAILAANHSGMLPIDGVMVVVDVLRHTEPPRATRPVGDLFIPILPFLGTAFSRAGVVTGSAGNFKQLLESGELALVFPEGTPGIGKGYRNRYELQSWRVGHAEHAIRHRAPVVPVAIIGAEEAWPQIAAIRSFRMFGAPYLPIPATPLPLPVRLHVHYGEPIALHEGHRPEDADDPQVVRAAAERVRHAVADLIAVGLRERKGVF